MNQDNKGNIQMELKPSAVIATTTKEREFMEKIMELFDNVTEKDSCENESFFVIGGGGPCMLLQKWREFQGLSRLEGLPSLAA